MEKVRFIPLKIERFIMFGLTLSWMATIFYFSHQPATVSREISGHFLHTLMNIMIFLPFPINEQFFHFVIRKSAHFFVYLILGILVLRTLHIGRQWKRKWFLYGGLFCFIYALSDEIHQLFIPGRSGELQDVILDTVGSVTGMFVYYMIIKRFTTIRRNKGDAK